MSDKESYNSLFRDAATKFYASLSPEDQEKHAKSYTDFIGMDHHAILSKIAGGNPDHTHDLATDLLYGTPTGRMFKTYNPSKSTLPQRFMAIARYARLDQVRKDIRNQMKAISLSQIPEDRGPIPIAKMQEFLDKKSNPSPQPKPKPKKKKIRNKESILPATAFDVSVEDKNWDDSDMSVDMAAKSCNKKKYARVDEPEIHPDFRSDGIAPRIGQALKMIASDPHPHASALAEGILRTGDHRVLPMLGESLKEINHPISHQFDWNHAPRGIAIDKEVKNYLSRYPLVESPLSLASGWANKQSTGVSKRKMIKTIRDIIKSFSMSDLVHSIIRLHHNQSPQLPAEMPEWTKKYHTAINRKMGTSIFDPLSYPSTLRASKSVAFSRSASAIDSVKKKRPIQFSKSDLDQILKTIRKNPKDQTAKKVLADYLEESNLHHDQQTLDTLRDGGLMLLKRLPESGKIKAISGDQIASLLASHPTDLHARKRAIQFFNSYGKIDPSGKQWAAAHSFLHNLLERGHDPKSIERSGVDLTDHTPSLMLADQAQLAHQLREHRLAPEPKDSWEDPDSEFEQHLYDDGSVLERNGNQFETFSYPSRFSPHSFS